MNFKALGAAIAIILGASGLAGCATLEDASKNFSRADFEAAAVENRFAIYFGHGSSELGTTAEALIDANANRSGNQSFGYIITGHTDTSDEASDNLILSRERAYAVANYLATANNVPRDRMLVSGLGETRLARQTPDGTRDPLNRRVEVIVVNLGL